MYIEPAPRPELFAGQQGIICLMDQAAEKSASTDAILARIREIFRAELEDEGLTVQLDTKQTDLKAWDSLAQIRLVSAVESEFEITVEPQRDRAHQFGSSIR